MEIFSNSLLVINLVENSMFLGENYALAILDILNSTR